MRPADVETEHARAGDGLAQVCLAVQEPGQEVRVQDIRVAPEQVPVGSRLAALVGDDQGKVRGIERRHQDIPGPEATDTGMRHLPVEVTSTAPARTSSATETIGPCSTASEGANSAGRLSASSLGQRCQLAQGAVEVCCHVGLGVVDVA